MPSPTVLVVIPVFNRRLLIAEALESVDRQSRPPHALVVIDDGSTDGSGEEVRQFFERRRPAFETRLVRQENAGAGAARRKAVDEAPPCELLATLDSDDIWPPEYLERMAGAMNNTRNPVGASCDRVIVNSVSGKRTPRSSAHLSGRATLPIFSVGTSPSSATVIRMDAYQRAGGYHTTRYKNDIDLYLRVSLLGEWAYVPGMNVTMRRNTTSTHGGAEHLTEKSIPNRLARVTMIERFIYQNGGRDAIPARVWRPHLARLWFRLGREYLATNEVAAASDCFHKATRLNPWHLRAWWKRLRASRGG